MPKDTAFSLGSCLPRVVPADMSHEEAYELLAETVLICSVRVVGREREPAGAVTTSPRPRQELTSQRRAPSRRRHEQTAPATHGLGQLESNSRRSPLSPAARLVGTDPQPPSDASRSPPDTASSLPSSCAFRGQRTRPFQYGEQLRVTYCTLSRSTPCERVLCPLSLVSSSTRPQSRQLLAAAWARETASSTD